MFCAFDCVTLWALLAPIGTVALMQRGFAQNIPETRLQIILHRFCCIVFSAILQTSRSNVCTYLPLSLNSLSAHSKSPSVIHIFSRSGSANFRVQRRRHSLSKKFPSAFSSFSGCFVFEKCTFRSRGYRSNCSIQFALSKSIIWNGE